MAGRVQLLTLLLLFLAALLIHYFLTAKEGFATARTPLTKDNVKSLLDSYVLALLGQYQKFKALNSSDPRIKFRLQNLASDINTLNDQYPAMQYSIEQYDYSKIPALSLEDLTIVKDFAIRTVGISYTSDVTTPANEADIDTMGNRLQSIIGIALQKAPLLGLPVPPDVQTQFQTIKTNLNTLKTQLPTMKPSDVPLFKGDFYDFAIPFAQVNFVPPTNITAGGIDIRTENLPKPQTTTQIVSSAIGLAPPPPATPIPAPVVAPAPLVPAPVARDAGMKFSELIKTLMTYTKEAEQNAMAATTAQTTTLANAVAAAATAPSKTVEPSPADMTKSKPDDTLKKMVSDEVDSRLKDFLLTPKDKQNKDIVDRSTGATDTTTTTKPVDRRLGNFMSDALAQGMWFRGAGTDTSAPSGCPYAAGQQGQAPQPYPIDMNDYIRKDSIPCYGCSLK